MLPPLDQPHLRVLIVSRHPYTANAALNEIVALTVEDVYARAALKECEGSHILRRLEGSSEKEVKEWASRALYAVENEAVHKDSSQVVTDVQGILKRSITAGGNGDGYAELSKFLKDAEKKRSNLIPLIYDRLGIPNSSFLDHLYFERAMQQAVDTVTRQIRDILCHDKVSITEPHSDSATSNIIKDSALRQWCLMLLESTGLVSRFIYSENDLNIVEGPGLYPPASRR